MTTTSGFSRSRSCDGALGSARQNSVRKFTRADDNGAALRRVVSVSRSRNILGTQPAGRCFTDGGSLRVSAALLSFLMTISPVMSFAQSAPPIVTQIIPDGRTATTVATNGSVSTVTTGTVSGPNAFNSFSQFKIGSGNTGNLILPNGTSNLINLISGNDPAVVNGVLNSYKNGQIGGNVYFASQMDSSSGRAACLTLVR